MSMQLGCFYYSEFYDCSSWHHCYGDGEGYADDDDDDGDSVSLLD